MNRTPRHIILTALLLLIGSAAMAQNDPQYVITNNGHYLEHVKVGGNWQLQNTDSFNPNCLWYSGNTVDVTGINHNYYFIDLADTSYHFLSAPLEPNGTLGLSASFPGAQLLRNVEQIYYFYNWDMESPGEGGGVARGLQYVGVNDSTSCAHCGNGGSWSAVDNQCWEVYWVEYKTVGTKWELSSASSYGITENSGRFRKVTVQEHLTPVENTGLINLKMDGVASTNFEISWNEEKSLSSTIFTPYRYTAYTSYVFGGSTHNYYNETPGGASSDHGSSTPTSINGEATSVASYEWTLTGDGANYISFNPDDIHSSSNEASPKLYYTSPSNTGNEMATLTLTVTYNDGSKQMLTATIKVKVECQNPGQEDYPIVTYDNVTVTWYNTADRYKIYWTKEEGVWNDANDSIVEGTNSYTFTDLDYNTTYWYKVAAFCNDIEMPNPIVFEFTTQSAPDLMIYGSVFGGGRMADVTGSPTIVIINCDTIGAVFGGNDIAGTVKGTDGSNIILGVDANDTYASAYNGNAASTKVRVNDVYGGGNGYYIYNGSSFESASEDTVYIADNAVVQDLMGNVVWTNQTGDVDTLAVPSIVKTAIKVTNNQVKIDSLFGGAKNAFLTYNDWHYNGDSIVIQGGTILSVFGGNNVGGGQGKGKHYIRVTGTTTNLSENITNTPTTGYGRDFGIRYLFGGGNKVYGSTTDVYIEGGQLDTIFAGGNSADVYAANITVNCSLEAGTGNTFGHTYSNAFESDTYDGSDIHIKDDYEWDGFSGIYNVRTLFGGNNEASFDSKGNNAVPNITLTSGSVGTVYGGGNAGDMLAHKDGTITLDGDSPINMEHSTKVIMNSPNMLVDYLYGGCQVSNVDYSTWVEIQDGHVGYVYGGCNVSGDVGSTRVNPHAPSSPPTLVYQAVQGSTYVKTTGGIVYKNLFAGGNGFYHCNDGINYIDSDIDYGDPEGYYIGLSIPTHNETHAIIGEGSLIKGNVYAGGNLAPVGFTDFTNVGKPFPAFVGLASVRVEDGTVEGDVYGGGNMAAIQGSNEVRVLGGTIGGALYGGNDRLGEMAQISNRVLPPEYDVASDGYTSLKDLGTRTYVAVSGRPHINTVYGGGNGAYDYSGTDHGGDMDYCNPDDQPIQGFTFVDIHIDGSPDNEHSIPAGHIETVYGGGNGVSVTGSITVFINVQNPNDEEHVGTVFGGNNMGDLELVPDVILLHGNVGTVYGGCNQGAMVGRQNFTIEGATYNDVGSMVHLRKEYVAYNSATTHTVVPTAKVLNAVYGGCRMNGVQYVDPESHTANTNTLVYVGSGTHPASMFGGSDISGTISGTSHVVVTGGQTGNIYGGGNGNYYYNGNKVYDINDHTKLIDTIASGTITAPDCATSLVEILGGQVGTDASHTSSIFGGGLGHETSTTGNVTVNIGTETMAADDVPVIYGDVYGGSALGTVNGTTANTTYQTTVNFLNGTLHGNVYGGGLGSATLNSYGYIDTSEPVTEAYVYGTVQVNIGSPQANATNTTYSNNVNIDGSVFGGNNLAGSPKANVYVDVYRTAHNTNNAYPNSFPDPLPNSFFDGDTHYALHEVYGGGNLAAYVPTLTDAASQVHVHNCDNTIQYVYGGGNAADVPTSDVTIDGGMIQYVFGGGNGYGEGNPGANVLGDNTLNLDGGVMCYVFGGSNTKGGVVGTTDLIFADEPSCNIRSINELYGGGNQAPDEDGITLNVPCGTSGVKVIYGGSRMADVGADGNPQDVVLNVRGGELDKVFGGNNQGGIIYGDVTVNLYGGTITDVFGGNNQGGNVKGLITVNVLDEESTTCPLVLTNVFGGGNEVAYAPADPTIISPVVNVTHITEKTGAIGIKGNVYGGGNEAGVTSNPQVNIGTSSSGRAYVIGGVYGGCNTSGTVGGSPSVNINNGTVGVENNANRGIVYGGGLGSDTKVKGSVAVTINDANAVLWGDVYGGSAKGLVNYDETNTAATPDATTTVTLTNGTIHGNLYGGGHGLDNASANVYGPVTVNIDGGTVGNVFGCNNLNGAPLDTVILYVTAGTMDSIFGGGNMAAYTSPLKPGTTKHTNYPALNISGGEVKYKVVGGGNAAGITGNPAVTISNGTFCTSTDLSKVGIYGGCNQTGEVDGDIVLTLTGDATHPTTIGTQTGMNTKTPVNIFGGGYGAGTNTTGSVTVNYGAISTTASDYPMLYGDLYGGSALGHVNSDGSDSTNVNVLNGSFKYFEETINQQEYQYGGSIYGGGLGNAGNAATVKGKVHVNIGAGEIIPSVLGGDSLRLLGNADLYHCNVYGCNNVSGTPLDDVYVDVFKTKQTAATSLDGTDYAIRNVFGGGNLANYSPLGAVNTNTVGHKTHVYIHGCDNTIEFAYGGGNAAAAVGSIILFDGGRFDEVFGGGNGLVQAANIGTGGVCIQGFGGHVNYMTEGSNKQGSNSGQPEAQYVLYTNGNYPPGHLYCGDLFVDSYFFGTNQAEYIGDLNNTITCAQASDFHFKYVYAGSRFAVIYGDVSLKVQGGEIQNVFGGSRGYENSPFAADIRKYPTDSLLTVHANDGYYSQALLDTLTAHPERKGTGGNVNLIIEGGTIGNVYGGCDRNGNVEGKITVTVKEVSSSCGLFVGDVYGASNLTPYTPNNSKLASPEVNILKGTLGGEAEFTMGSGSHTETLNFAGNVFGGGNKGDITSFPKVYIGDATNTSNKATVKGNVFGGGNEADVTGNTDVILQGNAEVKTNVYGGGYKGDVVGSSNVTIVPTQNP